MSLHQLAQHMQSAGRGDDKMLVHMTPGEVQGLQSLAMANGGSLTINPETGLPEAGFLSSLLPMIAGFALGPAGMGLMTSMQAGLAVGAVSTLATGSLSKGIMAGLGAYGGAGLGAGLSSMGGAAGSAGAAGAGTAGMNAAAANSMIGQTMGSAAAAPALTAPAATAASQAATGAIPQLTGYGPVGGSPFTNPYIKSAGSALGGPGTNALGVPVRAVQQVNAANIAPLAQPPIAKAPIFSGQTMQGLKAATSNGLQGFKDLYGAMEKDSPYSGMAAGYSLMGALNEQPEPPKGPKALIRPYTLDRQRVVDKDVGPSSSAERRYFNDVYTAQTPYEAPGPEYVANGGVVGMAAGGYIDNTQQQGPVNIESGNQFALQDRPAYTNMETPSPLQNTFAQSGDVMMPQGFASGGIASFAGGGMQSASNTYRDGAGFDVSGAAEALGGELPQYEYLGNNQYGLRNPVATTAAPKLSPTGQPVDASGGYYGPYGQYFNAAGEGQMWYMNPANYGPDAIKSAQNAGVTLKAPATTATASAPVTTQEGLEALYQQNFGRAADASGIESYLGKGYTPEQITGFMQSSEEYKPIKERLDEEVKQATYATPTQIANIYSDVFDRSPDMGGLDYYTSQKLTPEQVEQQLRQSEEYKTSLTKSLVPEISYTGSRLSYDDIKKQLGHDPTYKEVKAAGEAFIPNRATIEGAPEYQTPEQQLGLQKTKPISSTPDFYAMMDKELREQGGYAAGGDINAYSLGGYSDGGRLLRGPGDGVSDSIPASIGDRQPARLADGEFVVPARIVSELGNGSTEAGAKRLYAMMDRVQKARQRTVGKGKVAVNSKADKYLPA